MKIIDADWYETMKALQAVEEQSAVRAIELDSEPRSTVASPFVPDIDEDFPHVDYTGKFNAEKNEMAKSKKVTLKQLMGAASVLMRFLDEYQTVDKHNADAIVEYEEKVALIAIPLNIKKCESASSYSLVDLLQRKGEQNVLTINPGEEIKFDLRCQILEAREELYRQRLLVEALDEFGEPLLRHGQQVYKPIDHATAAEEAFWQKENKVN